ncbi:hypothetical protein V6N13_127997 [Hibiscus sabdariffa]
MDLHKCANEILVCLQDLALGLALIGEAKFWVDKRERCLRMVSYLLVEYLGTPMKSASRSISAVLAKW